MGRNTYQKFFKASIAMSLVASAFVVAPASEVNAQKELGKGNHKKDQKKYNNKYKNYYKKVHGKHKKPVQKVDKTTLQTTIYNLKNLKKSDYTVDSWNKLQQALSAAQRILWSFKATQADVTKVVNNLNAARNGLVLAKQQSIDVKVTTFKELKDAINNSKVKNISIQRDIVIEEYLKITSEKHINGNGYTLYGGVSKRGDNAYILQFIKTVGSVTNIKIIGADAAMYVDGSTVTLNSLIDVSGNTVAGIIVAKASSANNQPLVKIANATLVHRDETYYKPTILEDRIERTDMANRVVGYERMYVDYNQKAANHLQRFYYINHNFRAPNPINSFTLSLMHSNDTHANLNQIAKKVTAVKEVRAAKPKALLLDAGDVFTGTQYFNEFKGQADLQFMNLMDYDIMTFGDHEFDLGASNEGHQALVNFVKGAKFSFVSSNIDFSRDAKFKGLISDSISSNPQDGKIYNGIVKQVDGEKVGFFGLTAEETRYTSNPGSISFKNYIEEAKKAVSAFEKMGVNKIVAITHLGYNNDLNLAAAVEGIDVIVGGHSHTQLAQPIVVDQNGTPTIIVQAYQNNEYLGTLDVEFDHKGLVVRHNGKLIKISDKSEDPYAAMMLKAFKTRVN